MEFQKTVETRRSVRRYDPDKKIDNEIVKELIQAAIQAPSWKNSQTARYYCIVSEDILEKFKNDCLPSFNAKNVADAPLLIVSTFVKDRSGFEKSGVPTNEAGNGWGYYDLGLNNENLLLKATDLGLSTLVMGIRYTEKIRSMLSISDDEIIVSVIGVGYALDQPVIPKRKTVDEITRFF